MFITDPKVQSYGRGLIDVTDVVVVGLYRKMGRTHTLCLGSGLVVTFGEALSGGKGVTHGR